MLRPTSPRTSSSRPAAACSLSCVKYGVPIDSTMIEYGSMNSSQAFCVTRTPGVALGGCGEHARLHEPGELAGDHHQEGPAGEPADLAEADAAPAEVGTHVQAGAPPEEEQDDRLHDDAERRGAGEQGDHLRASSRRRRHPSRRAR